MPSAAPPEPRAKGFWPGWQDEGGDGLPFGRFQAEAVHACVQLDAKAVPGKGFHVPGHLRHRIQHGRQIQIVDHLGVARHMTAQDANLRSGAEDAA
ncbi:MAG: hypothetical protein RLZZ563_2125 [Pseudomonadota bacterium]